MNSFLEKFDSSLHEFSKWGVILCIGLMLSLSILNIVLRWFGHSILWIEPLVRHLVFLAAFLGGSLATGENQHIRIDLLSKIAEKLNSGIVLFFLEKITIIASLVATIILTRAAYDLVIIEAEFGKVEFLGLHSSYLIGIIPFGMGLISLRFFLRLFINKNMQGA
jgi:TRAP-type C4-dicarboxylate transport system permease small subunit